MDEEWPEGEDCYDRKCDGVYVLDDVENCSCHISAPCHGHLNTKLVCSECAITPEEWSEEVDHTMPHTKENKDLLERFLFDLEQLFIKHNAAVTVAIDEEGCDIWFETENGSVSFEESIISEDIKQARENLRT